MTQEWLIYIVSYQVHGCTIYKCRFKRVYVNVYN